MNIITAIALFGAGYIYNEKRSSKPRINYSYTPYKNEEKTLKQYFKNLAMDKMDILFYGGTGNRNTTIRRKKIETSFGKLSKSFGFNYMHIPTAVFQTRAGACAFIDHLCFMIVKYGSFTVKDYLDVASDESYNAEDFILKKSEIIGSDYCITHGWYNVKDINDTTPVLNTDGTWTIELPEPEKI